MKQYLSEYTEQLKEALDKAARHAAHGTLTDEALTWQTISLQQ